MNENISVHINEDGDIEVRTKSCCYDYDSTTLTPEEAISFGATLVEMAKTARQERHKKAETWS